ncbi:MAG: coenzyme F420-0:L-glutamate ligase [Oscillospiraceae bacterium]|nr:coenzyme F420-0:L-glutamate ligase [Oscillospiraceae bacterium]
MKTVGTIARGIRAPMIKSGDDIAAIVVDSVLAATKDEGFALRDRDVVAVTEAVVARAQSNYATTAQIAADIRRKFPGGVVAATHPIFSRNRFAALRGIAQGCDKLYIMLQYPSDEVGNHLISWDDLDAAGVNPYTDLLTEAEYRAKFGHNTVLEYTGVDYAEFYKSFGDHIEIIFCNDVRRVLEFCPHVLCCDIHTRTRNKRLLREAGAQTVYGLDDVLAESVDGSGYHEQYGLLGSNKATEDSLKLFPRGCDAVVADIAAKLHAATGKQVEVMVYGDGAFKDPVAHIWELADPVVSPGFTPGLRGTPSELKLKYLLDNELTGKSDDEVRAAIAAKTSQLADSAQGTTPRHYTDLLGSLCDLVSGSGDKGTPIVLVQGYFDNFAA